jgi:hypothetical protein
MLGHHPGKEKSEHKKTTSLIQIRRVSNNSSDCIRGVSNNSSEHIGGVSNNSSEHIREVVSNFSDMYSEGFVIISRSSEHLPGTPPIVSEELKVTP